MTILYKIYDGNGQLLYVGISDRWVTRMAEHAHHQAWWPADAKAHLTSYSRRQDALDAERHTIQTEKPLHNIVHNRQHRKVPTMPRKQHDAIDEEDKATFYKFAESWGQYFWVLLTEDTMYGLFADRVEVVGEAVIFWSESRQAPARNEDEEPPEREPRPPVQVFAAKNWIRYWAASVWDGHPVAVDWEQPVRQDQA